MQKIPLILKHIKVNRNHVSCCFVNQAYFATNSRQNNGRINKNMKSRDELAKELNEIKSRIGKVEPVKQVHEDLKKQEIEANRKYLDKWWLKMNVLCSITIISVAVLYIYNKIQERNGTVVMPPEEPDDPLNPRIKFLGMNIKVEKTEGPKRNPFDLLAFKAAPVNKEIIEQPTLKNNKIQ